MGGAAARLHRTAVGQVRIEVELNSVGLLFGEDGQFEQIRLADQQGEKVDWNR